MNELVIYPKKGKMILYGIGSFLFVALGVLLIGIGLSERGVDSLKFLIIGGISTLFFGFCMIYWVKSMINLKPALIINSVGITDQSSFISPGLVKWEEIEDIDFVQFGGQTYLGLFTKDPYLIINRSSSLKRTLNKMNKGLLPSQVNIPVKILNCSVEELVESVSKQWEKQLNQNA
jgi:hypothetical protein